MLPSFADTLFATFSAPSLTVTIFTNSAFGYLGTFSFIAAITSTTAAAVLVYPLLPLEVTKAHPPAFIHTTGMSISPYHPDWWPYHHPETIITTIITTSTFKFYSEHSRCY